MKKDPSRLTVGHVLAIGLILLIGFFVLPDRLSLVVLVAAMGVAAFLLNALFQFILRWFNVKQPDDEA